MPPFRILSLNGGGIRGAFGVAFLARLEELTGTPVVDHFDLIAGTSTGSIIAAALALGLPAADLVRFYQDDGARIFHPREPYRARGWLRPVFPLASATLKRRAGHALDTFFRARYCPYQLRTALTSVFGDRTLADLSRARVIIPSVNLTRGCACLFRTPHLPESAADAGLRVVDVLRAATAAPTYFPHKRMPDGDDYCDGGLWANAPAVVAVAEAMKIRQHCRRPEHDPDYDTSSIRLLSIGTGRSAYSLTPPGGDAGVLYWAGRIADVMGISQMQGVQLPMEFVLGDRYMAVEFDLPDRTWTLDAIARIPDLMHLGRLTADTQADPIRSRFLDTPAPPYVPFPSHPSNP